MTNEGDLACPDRVADITALVDGELADEDHDRLDQHLAVCSGCAAELQRQRLSKTALLRLSMSLNATPEMRSRLEQAIAGSAHRRVSRGLTLVLGVAAALLLLLVAGGGWYRLVQDQPSIGELSRAALTHERVTNGPQPVSFESSDPSRVAAWVRSVTGATIDAPVANAAGFTLAGARAASDVAPGSVTLVYESGEKRLSCTIVPLTHLGPLSPPLSSPSSATAIGGSNIVAWRDDKVAYLLIGDLDSDSLLRVARQIAQSD